MTNSIFPINLLFGPMQHTPSILILLSTYNGAKYLSAQLDSLINQTFTNWQLLIRNDGSTDNTLNVIQHYIKSDSHITLLNDNFGNVNVIKSFSILMEAAIKREEPYIFFCDQDDIWLPNKIEITLKKIQHIEAKNTSDIPVLVHTDLCVVDETLKTIHPSYLQYEHLKRNPENPLKTLIINNYVTGCTISMNRALLKLATPIPAHVRMHDWWCALVAAATGEIGFINEATMLYRQHSGNSIGSQGCYGKIRELVSIKKALQKRKQHLALSFLQIKALLARIDTQNKHYSFISQIASLPEKNKLNRYLSLITSGIKPANLIRGLIFWVFLGVV